MDIKTLNDILTNSDKFISATIEKIDGVYYTNKDRNLSLDQHLFSVLETLGNLVYFDTVKTQSRFIRFLLANLNFSSYEPYYKELALLFQNKLFFNQIDVISYLNRYGYNCRFGYDVEYIGHFQGSRAVKTVVIAKDKFKHKFIYYGAIKHLFRKNGFFKNLAKTICAIYLPNLPYPYHVSAVNSPEAWEKQFDNVKNGILLWANDK